VTLGTSLFLIAVGAILRFAVHVSTKGFNLHTIGLILMVVGIVGFVISLVWMTVWADRRRRVAPPEDPYYRRGL
jgi:heme/copper-type cytochrome/quinol oxidase subunit 2